MSDLIDRQAAIDALKGLEFCHYMEFGEYIGENTREVRLIRAEKAQDALQSLPSAEPPQTNAESTQKWQKDFREYIEQLDLLRDDYRGIMEYINEIPTTQSERKTERWILNEMERDHE